MSELTQKEVFTFTVDQSGNRVFGIPVQFVDKTSDNTYLITTPSGCVFSVETDADLLELYERDGKIVVSE